MTSSNSSLLRKADLAIEDIRNDGGELNPEQGNSFIRKMIKAPTILNRARVVEMSASTRKINKIGFGSRIMRKAPASGTALTSGQRAKPTTEQISLSTEEQIAEVRIPYDVMEDNIERATAANNEASNSGPGGLRQTILDLIAERSASDLEELCLLADPDYTNAEDSDDEDYLSQFKGWLVNVVDDGNVVDMEDGAVSKAMFKRGLKALPVQYQRNKSQIEHMISVNNETDWRDTLADRGTGLGDRTVTGSGPVPAYGSPVTPVEYMPDDKGIYSNPQNLIFGIQRKISLEFDKEITTRTYIIVLTCRVDVEVEEPEAATAYTNIGASAE